MPVPIEQKQDQGRKEPKKMIAVTPQKTEQELDDEFFGSLSMEPQETSFQDRLIRAVSDTGNYLSTTIPQSAAAMTTGAATWMVGKTAAAIIGLREGLDSGDFDAGMKEGQRIEEKINELFNYIPTDEKAKDTVNTISHLLDNFVSKPAAEVSGIAGQAWGDNPILQAVNADKLAPWIKYITQFGVELAIFKGVHEGSKMAGEKIESGITKAERKLTSKQKADIITEQVVQGKTPEQVIVENSVKQSSARPEEFFAKSAEESARIFEEEAKKQTQTYAINPEEFKPLSAEQKQVLSELRKQNIARGQSLRAGDVTETINPLEAKLQEIDTLISDIKQTGEEIGYGKLRGKENIKIEGAISKGTEINIKPQLTEAQSSQVALKIDELNNLRKVAEKSTGMNLKSFYDRAVDDIVEQLPKDSAIIVKSKYSDLKSIQPGEIKKAPARGALKIAPETIISKLEAGDRTALDDIKAEVSRGNAEIFHEIGNNMPQWTTEGKALKAEYQKLWQESMPKETGGEKRFISEEIYQAAKKRFDVSSKRLHSGVDPEMIRDAVIVGAYHIETGLRNFTDWSALMVKQYGEPIKDHLQEIWGRSHEYFKNELIDKTSQELKAEGTKPRKFLQTVDESMVSGEEIKTGVKAIKPQKYTVQPNAESLKIAEEKINKVGSEQAIKELSDMKLDLSSEWGGEVGARIVGLAKKYQSEKNFDKAIEVIEQGDRIFREGGRLIQTASLWNKLTPEGFLRWANKSVEEVNKNRGVLDKFFKGKDIELTNADKTYILEQKNKIDAMPDGIDKNNATLELMDYVAKKVPPTISELIDAYRYQNMLSGWQTQERNIGNNIFNTVITRPFDLGTKAMDDFIVTSLFDKERKAYLSDVPVYYKHVLNAVPSAIDAFKAVWKGTDPKMIKPELGIEYATLFEKARMKQMPKYLTVVQRIMEASDRFSSTLISAGEYAVRIKNGATPEQAMINAKALAEKYLYREQKFSDLSMLSETLADLEKVMLNARKLPVISKPMQYLVPFIKTPIRVGITMIEHSPLDLLRKKGFTPEVRAKIISGSIITAIGAITAYQGQTTWATPSDPKLKETFFATGRKPFSVKIGDKWVPFWYLGPYALAFALPTAIKYYSEDQNKALSDSQFDKLIDVAAGTARFIGSQSSTQSIGAFFNMLSGDIDYTLPGQLGFTIEQMIPASGFLRNTNKILDPVYRNPEGFWESIKKDLPLLSRDIPAHLKPMGEESEREWWNALLPYELGKEEEFYDMFYDGMVKEKQIQRLTNDFQKKLEQGKLTDENIDKYYNKLSEAYE